MPTEITPAEFASAQEVTAVYSNRVLVNVGGPLVRLSFMELSESTAHCRAAIAVPYQTAIELAEVLKRLLKDVEAQILAEMAEATKAAAATEAKPDA
jgi:hypothetical protein